MMAMRYPLVLLVASISFSNGASPVFASTLWTSRGITRLYPINVATGAVGDVVTLSGGTSFGSSDLAGEQLSQGPIVWSVSGRSDNRLSAMNLVTNQIISSVALSVADEIESLAIDPVTGAFYGASTTSLYRIAPATGAATLVGPTSLGVEKALGFDRLGNLYGIANRNQLVSVDKATAATSAIATLGVYRMEDIAARPETGVMYGLGYGPDYSLYQIDLADGSLNDLGPSLGRPSGLAFAAVPEPSAAVCAIMAAIGGLIVQRRALAGRAVN